MKRLTTFAIALGFALILPARMTTAETLRGPNLRVRLKAKRAQSLGKVARKLSRANVPGYGVLYKHREGSWQNATLVATVERRTVRRWMHTVGNHSIGFVISNSPDSADGSGFVRVGKTFFHYHASNGTNPTGIKDMVRKRGEYTEATFMVSRGEMKALTAFYQARLHAQIVDSRGEPIVPEMDYYGPSNMRREGCAGASSSVLNPRWVDAFENSLASMRDWGRQRKRRGRSPRNAILANVTVADVRALRGFIERTGAKQQTDPKALVRTNFDRAESVTIFNSAISNPKTNLEWNRGEWRGLAAMKTIPDLAPGQSSSSFASERLTLSKMGSSL
jgi:hypothetical protein